MMLAGSAIIMVISLVIRRQAYTLRSSSAILYQISPSMEELPSAWAIHPPCPL